MTLKERKYTPENSSTLDDEPKRSALNEIQRVVLYKHTGKGEDTVNTQQRTE